VGFWAEYEVVPCRHDTAPGGIVWRRVEPGTFPLAPRLSDSLGRLRDCERSALTEVTDYAESQGHRREDVPVVLEAFLSQEVQWTAGGQVGVPAPEVLLAFLLCLQSALDPTPDRRGREEACGAVHGRAVQFVRRLKRIERSPRQRQPEGQQLRKPSNALPLLPRLLARHVEAYRTAAHDAYAATGRVIRLRGYGNAIVPQLAAEFVQAFLEAEGSVPWEVNAP
jgi:hypothetical protein